MYKRIVLTCFSFLLAAPTWASTYNAYTDFGATNPSGAWAYGYAAPGAILDLDTSLTQMSLYASNCVVTAGGSADCWSQAEGSVSKPSATFDIGTVNYVSGYLNMHPSANLNLSVVAFIAPVAANYTFKGEFADHDVVGGNGTNVAAVLNDGTFGVAFTTMSPVSSAVEIDFTRALSAGQRVYFVVGANGDYTYDSIGLNLTVDDDLVNAGVPEPSSMILMGLGTGALALLRRR
jgi:hypothetical protein